MNEDFSVFSTTKETTVVRSKHQQQFTLDACLISISTSASLLMGHKCTVWSLPLEANRVPSSENASALTLLEWPKRLLQWNDEVAVDSLQLSAKHLAAKAPRRKFRPLFDDSFPSSSSTAAAASAVLLTDLLTVTLCPAIGFSTAAVVYESIEKV